MDASAKKLCDKIVADARATAAEIVEEARATAALALEQAERDAKESADDYLQKAKDRAERDAARQVSLGQLDLRNEMLALKQELLDSVFSEALETLKTMPAGEYEKLLSTMIVQAQPRGTVQLHLAAADRGRVGAELVESVNGELKSKGLGSVELGDYRDDIEAGFILKQGDVTLNFSFAGILSDLRETMENEIASLLFQT
jgi:V/A-type H+-transporting ATPase subunit E